MPRQRRFSSAVAEGRESASSGCSWLGYALPAASLNFGINLTRRHRRSPDKPENARGFAKWLLPFILLQATQALPEKVTHGAALCPGQALSPLELLG
jgi:hypothetical protein